MRYYDLQIIDPKKPPQENIVSTPLLHFSTHTALADLAGRLYDPGYLNIEFDIAHAQDSFSLNGSLTIHGIDLETVKKAHRYKGMQLYLRAGMAEGMPLSQPNSGLIFSGIVKEVVANWTGTEMNLQFLCDPDKNYQDQIYFQCRPHQPLKEAIAIAFQNAGLEVDVRSIPEQTKCPHSTFFIVKTVEEFRDRIKQLSLSWGMYSEYIVGYKKPKNNIWFFYPNNLPINSTPKAISFDEMIGQPTYNGLGLPSYNEGKTYDQQVWDVNVTTVMRGDIQLGDIIELPSLLQDHNLLGAIAYHDDRPANLEASDSIFSGKWVVKMIHHVGKSRDTDGKQWSSSFSLQRFKDKMI